MGRTRSARVAHTRAHARKHQPLFTGSHFGNRKTRWHGRENSARKIRREVRSVAFRRRHAFRWLDWTHGFMGRVISRYSPVNPHEIAGAARFDHRVSRPRPRDDARGRTGIESILGFPVIQAS